MAATLNTVANWEITGYGEIGATGAAQAGESVHGGSTVPARAVAYLRAGDFAAIERLISRSKYLRVNISGQDGTRAFLLCYRGAILARSHQPGVGAFSW